MDCSTARERLSLYLDGELSISEMKLVAEHVEVCTSCRAELSSLEETVALVRSLEPLEVPPELKDKILARYDVIDDASPVSNKGQVVATRWQRAWRRWGRTLSAAAAVLVAAVMVGRAITVPKLALKEEAYYGRDSSEAVTTAPQDMDGAPMVKQNLMIPAAPEYAMPRTDEAPSEMEMERTGAPLAPTERKVIQTAYLVLEIEKLDTAIDFLLKAVKECGGFIQSSNMFRQESLRGAHYTLRIPVNRFDNVLAQLEKLGDVENKGTTGQDVTEEYVDVDARCRNLVRQEERLLDILEQAKTVEDILKVEGQLERVRGEIEALTGRLRFLDNQVELSTVNVELRERPRSVTTVQLPDEKGLIARLNRAFTGSLNLLLSYFSNTVVWSVAAIPFLIAGACVGALIWWLWLRFQNKP